MSGFGSSVGNSKGHFMIGSGLLPGALGGTRTPNLLIRSKIRFVQIRPSSSIPPAGTPRGECGSSSLVCARPDPSLATALARSSSAPGADPTSESVLVARRAAGGPPRSRPPLTPANRAVRRGSDLPLFRM